MAFRIKHSSAFWQIWHRNIDEYRFSQRPLDYLDAEARAFMEAEHAHTQLLFPILDYLYSLQGKQPVRTDWSFEGIDVIATLNKLVEHEERASSSFEKMYVKNPDIKKIPEHKGMLPYYRKGFKEMRQGIESIKWCIEKIEAGEIVFPKHTKEEVELG